MDSKHSDDDYIINDTEYKEDEADIAFDKQEKSKKKGSVIRRIILIICIIVFCVSAGMLIKILLEYKKGSDIYKEPEANPGAKIWINISCNPIYEDQSDKVADFGERWFPKNGPTIYYESKCSHAEVLRMFMENILQDKSALDLLIEDIVK